MGRRAENRLETFRRVTTAAGELFAARGYESTTVQEIASRARVSPGTVYNHFGTKGAILFAVVMVRSSDEVDAKVAALDLGRAAPIDAVMAIVMTYIEPMLRLDRSLAAEVFGASFHPSRSVMLADFVALDQRAIGHLAAVFAALRPSGAVGMDVDPEAAAMLVFSVVAMATIAYLTDHDMRLEEVETLIRTHVDLAFRGIGG